MKEQLYLGQREAMKLALACFIDGLTREHFQDLPVESQVMYAMSVAELAGADELNKAYAYLDCVTYVKAGPNGGLVYVNPPTPI